MARVNSAIGRKRHGSVGGETYRLVNGITVVQEKSEGSTVPATEIQKGNRASFGMLIEIGKTISESLKAGFNEARKQIRKNKGRKSVDNAFIGINRKYSQNVFDYSDPSVPVFQPENLIVSKGSIAATPVTSATGAIISNTVYITWSTNIDGKGQNLLDQVVLVLYNETTDQWDSYQSPYAPTRSDGVIIYAFWPHFSFALTDVVRYWLFFKGYQTGNIGSTYTGKESDSVTGILIISE